MFRVRHSQWTNCEKTQTTVWLLLPLLIASIWAAREHYIVGQDGALHNIFLAQYKYTSEAVRTTGTTRYRRFIRQFYGGVSRNGYIYYFVADRGEFNVIRVLRVCDCAGEPCTSDFEGLYELSVECSSSAIESTRMCGVDLVESFADQTGPLVVLTRCEITESFGRNRVCALRLPDIDSDMDAFFDECKAGDISTSVLPWETPRLCTQFSVSKVVWNMNHLFCPQGATRCNFGLSPGISDRASNTQRFGYRFVNVLITASLAILVEDVSLVYVAHGGAIGVVSFKRYNNYNLLEVDFDFLQFQVSSTNTNSGVVHTIENVVSVRNILSRR